MSGKVERALQLINRHEKAHVKVSHFRSRALLTAWMIRQR